MLAGARAFSELLRIALRLHLAKNWSEQIETGVQIFLPSCLVELTFDSLCRAHEGDRWRHIHDTIELYGR